MSAVDHARAIYRAYRAVLRVLALAVDPSDRAALAVMRDQLGDQHLRAMSALVDEVEGSA